MRFSVLSLVVGLVAILGAAAEQAPTREDLFDILSDDKPAAGNYDGEFRNLQETTDVPTPGPTYMPTAAPDMMVDGSFAPSMAPTENPDGSREVETSSAGRAVPGSIAAVCAAVLSVAFVARH